MKLSANLGAAIVSLLFLGSMVEMRADLEGEFVAEYNAPRYTPMFVNTPGDSVAFPGAFGWGAGALTSCIRDTVIVEKITSLSGDTSVSGSLANTLKHKQHGDTLTIITWDLGGWSSPITWSGVGGYSGQLNCVYLAMQTAPGGGVGYHRNQIINATDDSKDFVIRGGTFSGDPRLAENNSKMMYFRDAQRGIFAENDFWFGEGEKMLYLRPSLANDTVKDITIQRNLFGYAQDVEPTVAQISELDETGTFSGNISIGYSLFHTAGWRVPMMTTQKAVAKYASDPHVRMVGNLWYNTNRQGGAIVRGRMVDVVDAYLKSGPYTQDGTPTGNDFSWIVSLQFDNSGRPDSATSLYVERLIGVHNRDVNTSTDSLWYPASKGEVACYYNDCNAAGGGDVRDSTSYGMSTGILRDTAVTSPVFPIPRISPFDLEEELAGTVTDSGKVGAYRRLKCDGTWEMRADSMHSQALEHVQDSTGVSSAPDSSYIAARYPWTKIAGSVCDDTDGDGMPDEYEDRMSDLDKNSATDRSTDSDGDGFPAALEYVNGTSSDVYTYSDGTETPDPLTSTYGNLRNVYLIPVVQETIVTRDQAGAVVDTFVARRPDSSEIDAGSPYRAIIVSDHDSALIITCDVMTAPASGVQDSADVDSIAIDWGVNIGTTYPRSVTVPGC